MRSGERRGGLVSIFHKCSSNIGGAFILVGGAGRGALGYHSMKFGQFSDVS